MTALFSAVQRWKASFVRTSMCLLCVLLSVHCVKIAHIWMHFCQKRFTVPSPHREELKGTDLSKWVTFPTASPVVNLMGSLSPHGHCCDSPVTNYHRKPINAIAMEERQHVKTTEAAAWSTKSVRQLYANIWKIILYSSAATLNRQVCFPRIKAA